MFEIDQVAIDLFDNTTLDYLVCLIQTIKSKLVLKLEVYGRICYHLRKRSIDRLVHDKVKIVLTNLL